MANLSPLTQLISLHGKRALITGAAVGIGKAIAYRLAEAGAALDLVDLDGKCLSATQGELACFDTEVTAHTVDLSSTAAIDELWASLAGQEPDILVNNVGVYPFKSFLEVDEDFYHKVLAINLHAAYRMCQHMIGKRRQVGGVIINVSSIEALVPFQADMVHYSVSKAGVIALTRSLAKEHARHGFRVNAVLPGGIITRGTRSAAKQLFRFKWGLVKSGIEFKQRLPAGRVGQPDEVARMVLVLASDLASYVHGAVIPIDGGFLAA